MWRCGSQEVAFCGRRLRGQAQEEAADEAAGQDDVPFDEVSGLRWRGGGETQR